MRRWRGADRGGQRAGRLPTTPTPSRAPVSPLGGAGSLPGGRGEGAHTPTIAHLRGAGRAACTPPTTPVHSDSSTPILKVKSEKQNKPPSGRTCTLLQAWGELLQGRDYQRRVVVCMCGVGWGRVGVSMVLIFIFFS